MPQLHQYHIFISHAWRYSEDYERLINLLRDASCFECRDYSISKDKSVAPTGMHVPDREILSVIDKQICQSSVVIVLLGMYASYHDWIGHELFLARTHGKPILGIKPWGQQRIPLNAQSMCDEIVGWNTQSITSAIRQLSI